MQGKAILLLSDNTVASSICEQIDNLDKETNAKVNGLVDQAESIRVTAEKTKGPLWDQLKEIVKEKLPEEFSDKTHHLGFNRTTGVVTICENAKIPGLPEGIELPDGIKEVAGRIISKIIKL